MLRLHRHIFLASLMTLAVASVILGQLYRHFTLEDLTERVRLANGTAVESAVADWSDIYQAYGADEPVGWFAQPGRLEGLRLSIQQSNPVIQLRVIDHAGRMRGSAPGDLYADDAATPLTAPTPDMEAVRSGRLEHAFVVAPGLENAPIVDVQESLDSRDFLATASPLVLDDGRIVGALTIVTDLRLAKDQIERRQWAVTFTGAGLLLVLYLAQLLLLRNANRLLARRLESESAARHAADARMQETGDLLRRITDALPVLVAFIDERGMCRFSNEGFEKWFGRSTDALLGRPLAAITGLPMEEITRGLDQTALGQTHQFDTFIHTLQGRREVTVHLQPREQSKGQGGCVVTIVDQTDHYRLARDLREARDEMEVIVARRTKELRFSEQRMRDVADAASDWFWETDSDHRFSWFSEGTRIAGIDTSVIIGYPRLEIIDTALNDPEEVSSHRRDLESRRPFRDFTYWLRFNPDHMKSGPAAPRLIRTSGKPVFDDDGLFIGYRGTATDVTDQMRAEERATRAESRLATALLGITDGLYLWDKEDRLIMWNKAAEDLLPRLAPVLREGLPFAEAVRINLDHPGVRLFDPESGESVEQGAGNSAVAMRRRRRDRDIGGVEIREPSGRWIQVSDRKGNDGQILTLCTDITVRKQIELALSGREKALKRFLQITTTPDFTFQQSLRELLRLGCAHFGLTIGILARISDKDYTVEAVARELDGITVGAQFDIEETYCQDVIKAQDTIAIFDAAQDPTRQSHPCYKKFGLAAYVGAPVIVETGVWGTLNFSAPVPRSHPYADDELQFLRLMAQWIGSELERQGTERKVMSAMEQSKVANRTKSEFLANMSHELRTPLNAILGFSDIIRSEIFGEVGNERYLDYAGNIHDSGTHLLAIINDILDVSKIEAGHLTLEEEPSDMVELMDACIRLVSDRARSGNVRLVSDFATDLPKTLVDPRRMKQILLNLLSNAVKFTPEGGEVHMTARASIEGFHISVRDTGVGMDEDEVRIAMQPFGQADSGLDRRHEGTGLGLPLTKALVHLHQGRLDIKSAKGDGTTVTVVLPAQRVQEGARVDPGANAPVPAQVEEIEPVVPLVNPMRSAGSGRS